MTRTKFPVRYLDKATCKRRGINLSAYPNAGPNCNVRGMRRLYWGVDAYLVRQSAYRG